MAAREKMNLEDFWQMDWSEKEFCIKCDRGGKLLVCSENDCPVAVHENCMGCPPKYDEMGHFYCPYCLCRQAVAESGRAREDAMMRQRALSVFLDKAMLHFQEQMPKDDGAEVEKLNRSQVDREAKKASSVYHESRLDEGIVGDQSLRLGEDPEKGILDEQTASLLPCKGTDSSPSQKQNGLSSGCKHMGNSRDDLPMVIGHKTTLGPVVACGNHTVCWNIEGTANQFAVVKVDKQVQAEHQGRVDDHQRMRVIEDNQEDARGNDATEVEDTGLPSSSNPDNIEMHDDRERCIAEDEIQEMSEASTDEGSSTMHLQAKRGIESSELAPKDSMAVSKRYKRVKQRGQDKGQSRTVNSPRKSSRRSTDNTQKYTDENEKVASSSRSRLAEQSQRFSKDLFGNARRKKLLWKEGEEEMLREGVHKFSGTINKNLPWRKILEFGRHVFDGSRTPADLKDKWRNMVK